MSQDRIASEVLGLFRSVWCERNDTKKIEFNCKRCEFEDGENCLVKRFIKNHELKMDVPQGMIKLAEMGGGCYE